MVWAPTNGFRFRRPMPADTLLRRLCETFTDLGPATTADPADALARLRSMRQRLNEIVSDARESHAAATAGADVQPGAQPDDADGRGDSVDRGPSSAA